MRLRASADGPWPIHRCEVFEAGDAFYLPPGHIGVQNEPGTEYLQFSPSDELRKVSEVMMKNMQEMQGA